MATDSLAIPRTCPSDHLNSRSCICITQSWTGKHLICFVVSDEADCMPWVPVLTSARLMQQIVRCSWMTGRNQRRCSRAWLRRIRRTGATCMAG